MTRGESSYATAPVDRVQFETLLSDISAQVIAGRPERLQETIESALDAVRLFFDADRYALLSVSDTLDAANVAFAGMAMA